MKPIFVLLLTILITPVSTKLMAKPTGQFRRLVYVADSSLAPLRLIGTVKGVTESRLFVETGSGVEHMIRIDGRTTIVDQEGKPHRICDVALLTKGLTVDVKLDSRDMVKSAVKVSMPLCQYRK